MPASPVPASPVPASPVPASPVPATGDRRPPWSVVVVALGLVVVSLALAVAGLVLRAPAEVDGERASALAAARERTLALTTYDYRTFDANVAAVLATATGPFQADYAATTDRLRESFTSTRTVAEGSVVAVGVESELDGRYVLLVAVDQVVRNLGEAAQTERNRLRLTLVRPGQTWLVELVERL